MAVLFATMLRQLRLENRLSQQKIADYLGVTRQAVASYEGGKREPSYTTLVKLSDFFGVSIDYLFGRSNCRELDAAMIGKNIMLIKGDLSYKELSKAVSNKTGVVILPEILEAYVKGEKIPPTSSIKVLAKYSGISDSFFYAHNTNKSYDLEKELYHNTSSHGSNATDILGMLDSIDEDLKQWMTKESNLQYIKMSKELQEAGLPPSACKPFVENVKNRQESNKS